MFGTVVGADDRLGRRRENSVVELALPWGGREDVGLQLVGDWSSSRMRSLDSRCEELLDGVGERQDQGGIVGVGRAMSRADKDVEPVSRPRGMRRR